MIKQQLPLGFKIRPQVNFNSFITGLNSESVSALCACTLGEGEQFSFIWGAKGCGKSHLLQATVAEADRNGQNAIYLPMAELLRLSPELLKGFEQLSLVCLDDVQLAVGSAAWEEALFHLFNCLREMNCYLVVSANQPPANLALHLADLKSRLTWGPCYQLQALDDQNRLRALIEAAEQRSMSLSDEAARYLLHRMPRDMHSLMALIEWLDHHSLVEQRRLTIPFVRKALEQQEIGR